jgi:hypothetical protein
LEGIKAVFRRAHRHAKLLKAFAAESPIHGDTALRQGGNAMRQRAAVHRRLAMDAAWRAPRIHRLRRGHRSGHHRADGEHVATDAVVEDGVLATIAVLLSAVFTGSVAFILDHLLWEY